VLGQKAVHAHDPLLGRGSGRGSQAAEKCARERPAALLVLIVAKPGKVGPARTWMHTQSARQVGCLVL